MALRKENTQVQVQVPAGQFEDEMDAVPAVAQAAPVREEHIAPAANVEPVAPAPLTVVPAAAPMVAAVAPSNTAMAIAKGIQATGLKQLEFAFDASMLESFGVGTFPRITVALDGYSINKGENLGDKVAVELASWNKVWLVTPGVEKPTPEENKLIRNSYDGATLIGGEGTVAEYVKYLKSLGYEKACAKQYGELWGKVVWSEKKGDVAPEDQQLFQISLSPQTVGQWGRYLLESGMNMAKGLDNGVVFTMNKVKKVLGSFQFAVSNFTAGVKK